ncbi:MAG TPA: hypothetical protein VE760_04070 [Acidimicrobiales bacterium]|nr:hypothetical protein [Acidimicrobiales bacterium]
MKRATLLAAACSLLSLAVIGPASAVGTSKTVSATVGPVSVPAVPVQICVDTTCASGPAATTVTLTASAQAALDVNPTVVPPSITPGTCPAGTGAVLAVNTGSVGATIQGLVKLTVNGTTQTIPIAQTIATPNKTVTVSACAV